MIAIGELSKNPEVVPLGGGDTNEGHTQLHDVNMQNKGGIQKYPFHFYHNVICSCL